MKRTLIIGSISLVLIVVLVIIITTLVRRAQPDIDIDESLPDVIDTTDDMSQIDADIEPMPRVEDLFPNDTDRDGISNEDEIAQGLNPNSRDTDSDSLSDKDELETWNTDPLKTDSDDDGVSDGAEILIHETDPNNEDTDGDGFTDGDEIANGYNPNGIE